MYNESRGILYTAPPTGEDDESAAAGEEAPDAADAAPAEAEANWAGDLTADD